MIFWLYFKGVLIDGIQKNECSCKYENTSWSLQYKYYYLKLFLKIGSIKIYICFIIFHIRVHEQNTCTHESYDYVHKLQTPNLTTPPMKTPVPFLCNINYHKFFRWHHDVYIMIYCFKFKRVIDKISALLLSPSAIRRYFYRHTNLDTCVSSVILRVCPSRDEIHALDDKAG